MSYWFDAIQQQTYISWEQLKLWEQAFEAARDHWLQIYQEITQGSRLAQHSLRAPYNQDGDLALDPWRKQWLFSLTEIFNYINHKASQPHVINEIEQFISLNYPLNITLKTISERFSLSREYISRRFKQEFKLNFSDYLTHVRLEKAKQLLIYTHLRTLQIAKIVGYKDVKYFTKVFKAKLGISINEYRNKFKEF